MSASRPIVLTAAQQFVNLRANPACAGSGSLHAGALVWRYSASPSPLGRHYDLVLRYRQGSAPETFVVAPDLAALAGGRRLPHVYGQRPPELCLYLPRAGQWSPDKRLDQTVVPWAVLWLFFFEDWLASGEWKGGGEHPVSRAEPRVASGRRLIRGAR